MALYTSDFESDFDSWAAGSGWTTRSTVQAHAGSYSVRFSGSNATATLSRAFDFDSDVKLTYWAYFTGGYWFDGLVKLDGAFAKNILSSLPTGQWVQQSIVIPAGVTTIEFYSRSDSDNSGSAALYIDDITIETMTLYGYSFESDYEGWTNSGSTRSTTYSHDGSTSVLFSHINAVNTITKTLTLATDMTMTFWSYGKFSYWRDALVKVDGTTVLDFLSSVQQNAWTKHTVELSAGTRSIQIYSRSDTENEGGDGLWIDDVTIGTVSNSYDEIGSGGIELGGSYSSSIDFSRSMTGGIAAGGAIHRPYFFDFETNYQGWATEFVISRDTTRAYDGSYSVLLGPYNSIGSISRTFHLDTPMQMRFWTYADYDYWEFLNVEIDDVVVYDALTGIPKSQWVRHQLDIPSGTHEIKIDYHSETENESGMGIWLDAISLDLPSVTVYDESPSGGMVASGVAYYSMPSIYNETSSGGVVLGGAAIDSMPNIYNESSSGGLVVGGLAVHGPNVYSELSSGGLVVGGVAIEIKYLPIKTMQGGLEIGGIATKVYTAFDCSNLAPIRCGKVNTVDTPGGISIGSTSWYAVKNRITNLVHYLPMSLDENHDLLDGEVTASGVLEITPGLFCDTAERFTSNRFYALPMFEYYNGFSLSVWYRTRKTLQEQTVFSINPGLRIGVSWNQEPLIEATWDDATTTNDWGDSLDTLWHLWSINFNPFSELSIFIDGNLSASVRPKRFLSPSNEVFIGRHKDGGYLRGDMQDFRLYDRPRGASEIDAEYQAYLSLV